MPSVILSYRKRADRSVRYRAQVGRFIALGSTEEEALASLLIKVISRNPFLG